MHEARFVCFTPAASAVQQMQEFGQYASCAYSGAVKVLICVPQCGAGCMFVCNPSAQQVCILAPGTAKQHAIRRVSTRFMLLVVIGSRCGLHSTLALSEAGHIQCKYQCNVYPGS